MTSQTQNGNNSKQKQPQEQEPAAFSPDLFLLQARFPELSKQSKKDLMLECEMWRRLWSWMPSEVKYFVARTGKEMALTLRNYQRYIGQLLSTKWKLEEVEIGTYDKVYDHRDGRYYFEKKIVKLNASAILDVQWIEQRIAEDELKALEEAGEETEETG